MYRQSIFNRCLESDLPFPELRPQSDAPASWVLRRARRDELPPEGELIGEGAEPRCRVALHRVHDGFVLSHSCTGTFHISSGGASIVWRRSGGAPLEVGRADVLGRVLAVAMHAQGFLSLHASAVEIDGGVIGFLGAKGAGKSTIAYALAAAGCPLVTDDTLPVRPGAEPWVVEGVQAVRLNPDSAARLVPSGERPARGADGKHRVARSSALPSWRGEAPLAALYVLSGRAPLDGRSAVARRRLPPRLAAVAVAQHTKVGALLGRSEAPVVLERAASLVRARPVFELDLVRDFARLGEVAERLREWRREGDAPPRERAS